jgi:SAM-dependent methyltransferase
MPYWPQQMRCDCADRLNGRARAVVHLVQATGLAAWTSMLLFGTPSAADQRLTALVGSATPAPRLRAAPTPREPERFVLDLPDASFHVAISQDYLEFVPPVRAALAEVARALVPGGRFIFTTQFLAGEAASRFIPQDAYALMPQTPAEYREDSHRFGWDLLTMLSDAGFSDAAAYLTWSEELGYLGSMNFLFRATR